MPFIDKNPLLKHHPYLPSSLDPISFFQAEILRVVASCDIKASKILKFIIDNSIGCITCIIRFNHHTSSYFSHHNLFNLEVIANLADHFSSNLKLDIVDKVCYRITSYRGVMRRSRSPFQMLSRETLILRSFIGWI